MKIIFMGTGGFAVPTLDRLLGAVEHDIVAVITMPMRNVHAKSVVTPVRSVAVAAGLEIFDPENINDPVHLPKLRHWNADLLFVCDYGKILAQHVLASTKFGGINLHGSLLPKYRGAAPINRALLNGEPTVGVSVIHMAPELDAGPVVAVSEPLPVPIDDTAIEIETKLSVIGGELVMSVLPKFLSNSLLPVSQLAELVSKAPKLKKQDGQIDWHRTAREIVWQYQAMQPWPKIFTDWHKQDAPNDATPTRLILGKVRALPTEQNVNHVKPGTIVEATPERIAVATGSGLLEICELQPAGKKMTAAPDFLRGHIMRVGDWLQ